MRQALAESADTAWLHTLFGFRARVVGTGRAGSRERARFSGWLIGTELRQAAIGSQREPLAARDAPASLWLVAEPTLGQWYQRAWVTARSSLPDVLAAAWPVRFQEADTDCTARGLYRLANGA